MYRNPDDILTKLQKSEVSVLQAAIGLMQRGRSEVFGVEIGREIAALEGGRLLEKGMLYRSCRRLEAAGALTSRWESHEEAEKEGRPPRRYYKVTGLGRQALAAALATSTGAQRAASGSLLPRPSTI